MLPLAPILHIHCGHNHSLRAESNEFVSHTGVAQVVANAEADFPPRRIPDLLLRRGKTVLKKLNRHALYLPKDFLAIWTNHKRRVSKFCLLSIEIILSASREILVVLVAPVSDR